MVTYDAYAAIRDKRRMLDAEVAKESGINPSTFSDWRSGRSKPKLDKLMRICAVLGVSVVDLIGEE